MTSDVSTRARAYVAEHLPQAHGLGVALSELIDEPDAFVGVLRDGLEQLADAEYATEQERVAPGSGAVIGVRWPLVHAVERQLRRPLAESTASSAIWLAQRLVIEELRELRLFAVSSLGRALPDDPERTWQVMRRLGRAANDWISVDAIADLVARGIVLEPYRWAELEQLIYSQSPWERRLVGATVARMPYVVPAAQRTHLDGPRGLAVIASLMGDADPNVQRALSWALREWTLVDPAGVTALLRREAAIATRDRDGHRAWVIRDGLVDQSPEVAAELRAELRGIQRRAGAAPTSEAAIASAGFRSLTAGSDGTVAQQGERMARIAS